MCQANCMRPCLSSSRRRRVHGFGLNDVMHVVVCVPDVTSLSIEPVLLDLCHDCVRANAHEYGLRACMSKFCICT